MAKSTKKSASKKAAGEVADLEGFPEQAAGKGDVIHSAIWFPDVTYKPGDEDALLNAGFEQEKLQEWADKGLISGFGTEFTEEEEEK